MKNYFILFLLVLLNSKCSNITVNKRMDNDTESVGKFKTNLQQCSDIGNELTEKILKKFKKICFEDEYDENNIKDDLDDLKATFDDSDNDSTIYRSLYEEFGDNKNKKIIFDALKLLHNPNYFVQRNSNDVGVTEKEDCKENLDCCEEKCLQEFHAQRRGMMRTLYRNIINNFDDLYAKEIDCIIPKPKIIIHGETEEKRVNDSIVNNKKRERIWLSYSYGEQWSSDIKPKYQHLKEEALNNTYAPITEKTWNGILTKCKKILKGEFASKRTNRLSKLLRYNKIGMKHLVALKLYTDFDLLQREFKKSFRSPYNKTKERSQSFYHFREALQETFLKFSMIPELFDQQSKLFTGVNSLMCLDKYDGKYYGPCSTTTDLHVARGFAGKYGMMLIIKPEIDLELTPYKILNVSWISDYPDENEYLLLNHKIKIVGWILSSDYDEHYFYYHNVLTKRKIVPPPSNHISLDQCYMHSEYMRRWSILSGKGNMQEETNIINLEEISLQEKEEETSLTEKQITCIFMFIFGFILSYKYPKNKASKYDQFLNSNIQNMIRKVDVVYMPSKMVILIIKKIKEWSKVFEKVKGLLNKKFRLSYHSDRTLIECIQYILNGYFMYTKWELGFASEISDTIGKIGFPSGIPVYIQAEIKDCINYYLSNIVLDTNNDNDDTEDKTKLNKNEGNNAA